MMNKEALKELQACLAGLGRDCKNTTSLSAEIRRHANGPRATLLLRRLLVLKKRQELSSDEEQSLADLNKQYSAIFAVLL